MQVGFAPAVVQAPPQFRNALPAAGVAVRVTRVPGVNLAVQVPPQLIVLSPAGVAVTVPELPRLTCRVKVLPPPVPPLLVGCGANVATAVTPPLTVTTQVYCVPAHAPLHTAK